MDEQLSPHPVPALDAIAAGKVLRQLMELSGEAAAQGSQPVRVPGYTISHVLGSGGAGIVYYARADVTGQPVALKVMRAASGAGVRRASRELDLLAEVRLACVPRLLDFGVHDGVLYLVTDLVEGEPIDAHCVRAGLDVRGRAALLAEVAEAVQNVHERGIIHRDLKPGNVLVETVPPARGGGGGAGRRVWIIDFGHAAARGLDGPGGGADGHATATFDGLPVGTPAFMAPEAVRGETATTRSDVYGLGAIGYLLLTGRPPLAAGEDESVMATLRRAGATAARETRAVEPGVVRGLGAVVDKACAFAPGERYGSAGDFAADLRRYVRGEPVEAQPPGPARRAVRWAMRRPLLATAGSAAVIGAGIIGGSVGLTWYTLRQPWRVEVTAEHTYGRAVSRGGEVLRTVGAGTKDSVRALELVDRPRRLGGGKVLVGMWSEAGGPCRGMITEPHEAGRVLWSTPTRVKRPEGLKAPERKKEYAKELTVRGLAAVVADLLPDPPGEEGTQEIAVVLGDVNLSPCCVRVYDLGGNLRFEAWHDGWLYDLAWLPGQNGERGTLFAAGVSDRAELPGAGRSAAGGVRLSQYAVCVMGLDVGGTRGAGPVVIDPGVQRTGDAVARPEGGGQTKGVWLGERVRATGLGEGLKWYRYVQPWEVNEWLGVPKWGVAKEAGMEGRAVRLVLDPPAGLLKEPGCPLGPSQWLTVDGEGEVGEGAR